MKKVFQILLVLLTISCKNETKEPQYQNTEGKKLHLKYAKGFSVKEFRNYKIVEIINPWPNSEKSFTYILSDSSHLNTPIKKIVVTSTTHIPALELLNVEHSLVGFPGIDYVSSKSTRRLIDDGKIRELGKNESINTEVLLELKPDVVIGFGVDGLNKTFETIEKSGIPVIYNGDWVETSPLAKAEWIKFFGVLYNKEKEADSIFNIIEKNYIDAKTLASKVINKPTILSGAMHKDVWYLPNGSSPEAQLLNDANVNYLWSDTTGNGSLALSFETIFEKAKDADLWLSPSYYNSLEAVRKANEHYTKFSAFKNHNIYSFSNTTGETGGVTYYELGIARPDLVLKDIIKICHPELLQDYKTTFFKPLL